MRAIEALWGWWMQQPEGRSALVSSIGLLAAAGFIFWCGAELASTTTGLPAPAGDQAVNGLERANEMLAVVLYIGGAIVGAAGIALAWFSRKRRFGRSG